MKKVNLLLVDDEPDILDLWRVHFEQDRFEIYEARNGQQAVQVVNEMKEVDSRLLIVLLDVKMPGVNGLEALDAIRRTSPDAKIFIITGNVEDDEIADTAYFSGKIGGDGFFEKSKIDFAALKAQIDAFIERESESHNPAGEIRDR